MIRAWGGWELFQELLAVLKDIAGKRGVDVSSVAARWVLEQPETGVVIVGGLGARSHRGAEKLIRKLGSRLGVTSHIPSTVKTLDFDFTEQDQADIERVISYSRVQAMFDQIGDCGSEYR